MKKYKVFIPLTFRDEFFVTIPDYIIDSTINRYTVSNYGRVRDEWERKDVTAYYTDPNYKRLFVDLSIFNGIEFVLQTFPLDMIVCMTFNNLNTRSSRSIGYKTNNLIDCSPQNLYWKDDPISGTVIAKRKNNTEKKNNGRKYRDKKEIFTKEIVLSIYSILLNNYELIDTGKMHYRDILDMCGIQYIDYYEERNLCKIISNIRYRKDFAEWTKDFRDVPSAKKR